MSSLALIPRFWDYPLGARSMKNAWCDLSSLYLSKWDIRWETISKVAAGTLSLLAAARTLNFTADYIARLLKRYRDGSLPKDHGLVDRRSNNSLHPVIEDTVRSELRRLAPWPSIGEAHRHVTKTMRVRISKETVRRWMIQLDIHKPGPPLFRKHD